MIDQQKLGDGAIGNVNPHLKAVCIEDKQHENSRI